VKTMLIEVASPFEATMRRRRASTSLVASFAAGVAAWDVGGRYGSRGWRSNGRRPPRTGVRIATFRCNAPARYGVVADERRIVAGERGGPRFWVPFRGYVEGRGARP
jgi:hypothetical protein